MNLEEHIELLEKKATSDIILEDLYPCGKCGSVPYSIEYVDKKFLENLYKKLNRITNIDYVQHIKNAKKIIRGLREYAGHNLDSYCSMLRKDGCFLTGEYTLDDAEKEYIHANINLKKLVKILNKLI